MNARKIARKSMGRPKSPDRSELTKALIAKQDAQARRLAAQVREILGTHFLVDDVELGRQNSDGVIRARLLHIPSELTPQVAASADANAVATLIDQRIRAALDEVADTLERPPVLPCLGRPPAMLKRPGPIRPSKSLALARARCARLSGQLMDLKRSIGRTRR
jgi:hypothetical protein